jgi:serine/threonine protein kinase
MSSPALDASTPPGDETSQAGLPDRYQHVERTGLGAAGEIFSAIDRDTGGPVIVQLVQIASQDNERLRLARRLVGLTHRSLVSVLEVGLLGDRLLIVTESDASSRSLEDLLKQGLPKPQDLCRWLAEIAEACQFLLDKGFLHVDVKPTAILVGKNGIARLGDLVGSCVLAATPPAAAFVGTPDYTSPERMEPAKGSFDVRSTIYSLGVVLFEGLTGVRPFAGADAAEIIRKADLGLARVPRAINKSIPEEIESICLKAMARNPDDRHATLDELAQALRAVLPAPRRGFWKRK